MDSLEALERFFGWCTLLNTGLLVIATIVAGPMREWTARIHGKMFGVSEADLSRAYFQYLAQYKIAIFIFNLVPYLALKISA